MSASGRLQQFDGFERAAAELPIAVVRVRTAGVERRAAGRRHGSTGSTRPDADVRFCVRLQSSRWELPPSPHADLDKGTHSVRNFLDSA